MGENAISPAIIAKPPAYDRARAAVAYDGIARRLAQSLKYNDRTDLAPWLAAWMIRAGSDVLADADLIVPVPLHRKRLWRRRFNQSAELARTIGRRSAITYAPEAVQRIKQTRQQVGLKASEREDNVRKAFAVTTAGRAMIVGKHVLVIDDVFTTGATVGSLAATLKQAGASRVSVLTFARVLPGDFRRAPQEPI